MRHESCGAIAAAVQGGDNSPNLNTLVKYISNAIEQIGKSAPLESIVKENAKNSAKTLVKNSDIISSSLKEQGGRNSDGPLQLRNC